MIRKTILVLWLCFLVFGSGYYFWSQSRKASAQLPPIPEPPQQASTTRENAAPPLAATQQRNRTSVAVPAPAGSPTEETRRISLPLPNLEVKDIQDTFDQARGSGERHEATDILAPRGTPVLAVDSGVIRKLFLSKAGGLTIYQVDPTEKLCYYYAHLDRYAPGLTEGQKVRRGEVIGYVGTTGNADPNTPHLHFGISELGPEKVWWKGTWINPYPFLIDALKRGTRQ
jgi:murein DD-endopeptidase MepM/ murein hydrolase activator NlpD